MGNAGSSGASREHHRVKHGEPAPPSPSKEGQAFTFEKKPEKFQFQGSQEDDEPFYTRQTLTFDHNRPRSNTGENRYENRI